MSAHNHHLLFEAAPVAMCLVRGGTLEVANESCVALLGLRSRSGLALRDLLATPQDPQALSLGALQRAIAHSVQRYPVKLLRDDGAVINVRWSSNQVALPDGAAALCVLHDTTQQDQANAQAELEHQRTRQYIHQAEAMLVGLDTQGRVTLANRQAQAVLGRTEAELLGQDWFIQCVPTSVRQVRRVNFHEVLQGRREPNQGRESMVLTGSGDVRLVAWSSSVLRDERGQVFGVLSCGHDVTEQHQAEEDRQEEHLQLQRRLNEHRAALEAANLALAEARHMATAALRAKSNFLANMSHEVRTPMNAVLGMVDLALRLPGLDAQAQGYLRNIQRAGSGLQEIIDSILDYSSIESGEFSLEVVPFKLAELLGKVAGMAHTRAAQKGLAWRVRRCDGLPEELLGDQRRIVQVLVHLCSNALKFTAQGEVSLHVGLAAGPAVPGLCQLCFEVRDTGIGMDAASQAHLFKPFNLLDDSSTRRHGGTGVGLAVCRQLVERMSGQIEVRSAPGEGSVFTVNLPLQVMATGAANPALGGGQSELEPASASLHVCVVDDDDDTRQALCRLLAQLGHDVVQAHSTSAALASWYASAEAAGRLPDCVVVDWRMLKSDGFELVRRFRERKGSLGLRLVLQLGQGSEVFGTRALEQGFDAVLYKPVRLGELAKALKPRSQAAQPASVPAVHAVLKGKRVLLVEDNELNQIVASDLLEQVAGAHVTVAHNGREGVTQAQQGPFDLVLMDVQMPVMDGYEATRLMRADPALRHLPIVAMTAHALSRDREWCRKAGMDEFISKPFDPATFFEVLARVLQPGGQAVVQAEPVAPASPQASPIAPPR